VSGSPELHGQSPWGSSSPRASRTSFAPPEDPPSPSTPSRDQTIYQPQADSPPTTSSHVPPSGHEQHAEHEHIPPPQSEVHSGQQSQPQQAQQPQQRPGAARYQAARQHRQPPQYKLQAKITALERTGRKDPVLRFDVHVRKSTLVCAVLVLISARRICLNFGQPSFATFAEHILSSRNSRSTSYPRTRKHWCLQYRQL
jgi:FtsZ-interacting cell division protein ZipA